MPPAPWPPPGTACLDCPDPATVYLNEWHVNDGSRYCQRCHERRVRVSVHDKDKTYSASGVFVGTRQVKPARRIPKRRKPA